MDVSLRLNFLHWCQGTDLRHVQSEGLGMQQTNPLWSSSRQRHGCHPCPAHFQAGRRDMSPARLFLKR